MRLGLFWIDFSKYLMYSYFKFQNSCDILSLKLKDKYNSSNLCQCKWKANESRWKIFKWSILKYLNKNQTRPNRISKNLKWIRDGHFSFEEWYQTSSKIKALYWYGVENQYLTLLIVHAVFFYFFSFSLVHYPLPHSPSLQSCHRTDYNCLSRYFSRP